MNMLVCVKQVPGTNTKENRIVNPFDLYALETALRIKEAVPVAGVTALSMGPGPTESALRQCLAIGADAAYLACDSAFAGADTLATSYVLSKAVRYIEAEMGRFDLILCGLQAIDGDTAQTGPMLAERLGYPQITCVKELRPGEGRVRAVRETQRGLEIWEAALPAVITVTKPDFEPRRPTLSGTLAARRAEIPVLTAREINADPAYCGQEGSPTVVRSTYPVQPKDGGVILQENGARAAAVKLAALLRRESRL